MNFGPHGMIEGEIDENTKEVKLKFIEVDEKEFKEVELDITGVNSNEELTEKINEMELPKDSYIKIVLVGNKEVGIDTEGILKYVENSYIIKIKDKTKLDVNLESLRGQNNLKGLFIKKLLEKKEKEPENSEKIDRAIEIGLSSFN